MEEGKKYIEIMEELSSKVFPPTTEFNYHELSPQDLWEKVQNFLSDLGILSKISQTDLSNLENFIISKQKTLYQKKSNFLGKTQEDPSFDQNNYNTKKAMLEMKNDVVFTITNFGGFGKDLANLSDVSLRHTEFGDMVGETDKLVEYVSPSEVEKYVRDLLTISVEEGQRIIEGGIEWYITRDILSHFGFNPDYVKDNYYSQTDSYGKKLEELIRKILQKVVKKSTITTGAYHEIESGVMGYDDIKTDISVFTKDLQDSSHLITEFMNQIIRDTLEKRKTQEVGNLDTGSKAL